MSEFDQSGKGKFYGARSTPLDALEFSSFDVIDPKRMSELECAYYRALDVVLRANYAQGDPNVAKNVARIVLAIWQKDPRVNFLRLTNGTIFRYQRQRAGIFGAYAERPVTGH
jgi:hypothetical protein